MSALGESLQLPAAALVASIGERMRPPREHDATHMVTDDKLLKRSKALHQELMERCVLRQVAVGM
jgi:hypothetical protein